jgi:tetratricopeptide (TPR) repeat protein
MVCPTCSAVNPDNMKFCGHCGTGLLSADDAQTILLDGPAAAAAAASTRAAQVTAGLISPPPEGAAGGSWAASSGFGMPSALAPGSFFGSRYRIEGLLGEGGMGAVYKAYDVELDRSVALKLVRPELAASPQAMQRFKQELLLASRISHRNILRIHDLGDWNGVKFITMALVEGTDLAGLIEVGVPLSFDRALKFTRQLCAALAAAHDEGVVHRDLKPQNILIDAAENIYVSDFGLAKSLEAGTAMMTRTGQILGTPRYMSPEQVEAKEVDHRSDLYSLGLILFEMFTGELPFRGDSAMQLMYQRVTELPKDPRSVRPGLPAYLARIILKCLERDPAKRYQSPREILEDLDTQPGLPAPRAAGAETISIVIPKPKGSWWLGLLTAAVLGAGFVFAIPSAREWALGSRAAPAGAIQPLHYVAVLPLNSAGDEGLKYVADGVVDAITARLGGLKQVYVASGAAVNAAVSKAELQNDPAKIARALGVKLVLQGSIQGAGDQIAIAMALDDPSQKKSLLNREFRGNRRDLLVLEDQIFNEVLKALVVQQSNEERARTAMRPTADSDAYDLYLKGRNLLRGRQDVKNIGRALDLFDQAIKRDFSFALAYAGTADASIMMWDQTKDSRWTEKAVSAAMQAESLNSNLVEAHLALGTAYTVTGNTAAAISEIKLARDLAPNSDDALRRLGKAYEQAGRLEEAIAAYTQAKELNPYLWRNLNELGAAYVRMGKNDRALEVFREAARRQPDNPSAFSNMGVVYYRQGRWSDCIPAFQKAKDLQPSNPLYYSNLGVATFFAGRYQEAAGIFAHTVAMSPKNAVFRVNLADAYRWSNEPGKASEAYDAAITVAFDNLSVNPKNAEATGILAISYAKKGDDKDAMSFLTRARQIDRDSDDLMYKEATIHTLAGRIPEALASLAEAVRHGHSIEEARSDPELRPLRDRQEFAALVKQQAR